MLSYKSCILSYLITEFSSLHQIMFLLEISDTVKIRLKKVIEFNFTNRNI